MPEQENCIYRERVILIRTGDLSEQGFPDVQTDEEEAVLLCNVLILMGGHRHGCVVIDQDHLSCPIARLHDGDPDAQMEVEGLF